jgi:sporulation protein YlmC with PRC-barrel domain
MAIESVSDIKNIPVVSVLEGAILGLVSRVYIDPEKKTIAGVAFKKSMLGPRLYVAAGAIERFGRDVVLIDEEAHVIKDGEGKDSLDRRFRSLRKTEVATTVGDVIGSVDDFEVSAEDGAITRLVLVDGRSIDLGRMDVSIGLDHVVVREDQVSLIEAQGGNGSGVVSRLYQPDE